MMSMLVHALGESYVENNAIYRQVIDGVECIFNADTSAASLVSAANMIFRWPPQGMRRERKLFAGTRRRICKTVWIYGTNLIQFALERFSLSAGEYDAPLTASNCTPIRTSGALTTPYA